MTLCNASLISIALMFGVSDASLGDVPAKTELKLFGHEVRVIGPLNEQKLTVDDKPLVSAALISIDSIEIVDGIGVLVGDSSNGGNICNGSPFIVSFPVSKPVKIDGPLDECRAGKTAVRQRSIEVEYTALPNKLGRRYVWTPHGGFEDLGDISFSADKMLGWNSLRPNEIKSPIDLYKFGPVASGIKDLTGEQDTAFIDGLSVGSGTFDGDVYVGAGCVAHNCPFAGSFILVDRSKRKIFLAWKEDGQKFVVRPPVSEWPGDFRVKLKNWTQNFR